jgi:hypothetical protein
MVVCIVFIITFFLAVPFPEMLHHGHQQLNTPLEVRTYYNV